MLALISPVTSPSNNITNHDNTSTNNDSNNNKENSTHTKISTPLPVHVPVHSSFYRSSTDQTESRVSTSTLNKLKRLSTLPRVRENIDFLSATLPHLSATTVMERREEDLGSLIREEIEDEI